MGKIKQTGSKPNVRYCLQYEKIQASRTLVVMPSIVAGYSSPKAKMDHRLKKSGMRNFKREDPNVSAWGHGLCVHIFSRRVPCFILFEVSDL